MNDETPLSSYRGSYQQVLAATVNALTEAARLPWPRLRQSPDGIWAEDDQAPPQQTDWAEFVTLALAGAAANLGGIDAALDGRPGSWEADGVRQLLVSTVGEDETRLWEHRTEPVVIALAVDQILSECTAIHAAYYAATEELDRRFDAMIHEIDYPRLVWAYERNDDDWVSRDPEAPVWSWEAWLAQPMRGKDQEYAISMHDAVVAGGFPDCRALFIPKSLEAAMELQRQEDAQDAHEAALQRLDELLEKQRRDEWTAYGERLKARIEALAAAVPGLSVPVVVLVETATDLPYTQGSRCWSSLESVLIERALESTSTPEDLPGTPLQRLEAKSS